MIKWNGIGEPTTGLDRPVKVKLRSGRLYSTRVGDLRWTHDCGAGDVVEYELLEELVMIKRLSDALPVELNPGAVFAAEPGNHDAGGTGRVGNPKDAAGDKRIPLWLLSGVAKIHWALAQFAGLLKYGAWNWRVAGVRYSVYLSALERHIEGIKAGEDYDPLDGTHHLGNIMACAALILDAGAAGKLTDDRPPRLDHRPTIAFGEELMVRLRDKYKDHKPRHFSITSSSGLA